MPNREFIKSVFQSMQAGTIHVEEAKALIRTKGKNIIDLSTGTTTATSLKPILDKVPHIASLFENIIYLGYGKASV